MSAWIFTPGKREAKTCRDGSQTSHNVKVCIPRLANGNSNPPIPLNRPATFMRTFLESLWTKSAQGPGVVCVKSSSAFDKRAAASMLLKYRREGTRHWRRRQLAYRFEVPAVVSLRSPAILVELGDTADDS